MLIVSLPTSFVLVECLKREDEIDQFLTMGERVRRYHAGEDNHFAFEDERIVGRNVSEYMCINPFNYM